MREMSFSERLNEWLKEQGKEPISPEIADILDRAAKDTLNDLEEYREEIVAVGQFLTELTGQTEEK